MTTDVPILISLLSAAETANRISGLSALLHACVEAGASIGFILPHAQSESEAFWRKKVLPAVADGSRLLFVATCAGRIVGSVQLDYDTPANQPHRAEVRKLLVHPDFRRRGIAKALMQALEQQARDLKRSLLTLDTRTGDNAEPLYASLGYATTGVIPNYCRDTIVDRLDSTTIMYKML
jgi:ribosomal protein S18 acetylase RimI-like enzyme